MSAARIIAGGFRIVLVFLAAIAFVLALRPDLRLALQAAQYDPRFFPAFENDARIRYEPASRGCAAQVAALLPAAVARIEEIHARPFAKAPIIAIYDSFDKYARANGLDNAGIAGVTRPLPGGAVAALLSPTLCGEERDRLAGVMTHELSHVHFAGWRKASAARPPQWFTEGLAVMASQGGGAEGLSDEEAAQAIREGVAVILDDRPWHDFAALAFSREPATPAGQDALTYRQRLAYRQASIFVSWLRAKDEAAFVHLLRQLENGESFDDSFREAFNAAPNARWADYAGSLRASR